MKNKQPIFVFLALVIVVGLFWFYFIKKTQPAVAPILTPETSSVPVTPIYNTTLSTLYVTSPQTIWPPQVTTEGVAFSCNPSQSTVQGLGKVEQKTIEGKSYCVTTKSEGAAGSTYTTYVYQTGNTNETTSTTFTLRFVQCMNYDNPKQTECLVEQKMFDPDFMAYKIIENSKR